MKIARRVLLYLLVLIAPLSQAKNSFTIKGEQVIDLLYLNDIPGNEQAKKQYFKDIGPVGRALGYKPLFAFFIKEKPVQGNYFPNVLAIAAWPGDMHNRMQLFDQLLKKVPDIHQRRFDVWSSFHMTNYYIENDLTLSFDDEKRYVIAGFWQHDNAQSKALMNSYQASVNKAGGQVMMALTGGSSPFGYMYNPDFTVITEWPNLASFERFSKANQQIQQQNKNIKHINELHLQLINRNG